MLIEELRIDDEVHLVAIDYYGETVRKELRVTSEFYGFGNGIVELYEFDTGEEYELTETNVLFNDYERFDNVYITNVII